MNGIDQPVTVTPLSDGAATNGNTPGQPAAQAQTISAGKLTQHSFLHQRLTLE